MNVAATIARYLLALMFVVFGLNGFLHFIPLPPPASPLAGQYFDVMVRSHYLVPVFAIQLVAGLLFLANRFVPLALVLIAPILVNVLLFHGLMDPAGLVPGLLGTALWAVVFARHRAAFDGILRATPTADLRGGDRAAAALGAA